MIFTKYAEKGAYHWKFYEQGTKYRAHADRVRDWVKERPVLDVGAGDGLITHLLGAVGIDDEETAVRLAIEKGVDVRLGNAYALPFPDDSFGAVTMIDVLEHFDDPSKALAEARRVAPVLYICTPPKRDDGRLQDRFHVQEWSPYGLTEFVESNGYEITGDTIVDTKGKFMYARFIRSHGDIPHRR